MQPVPPQSGPSFRQMQESYELLWGAVVIVRPRHGCEAALPRCHITCHHVATGCRTLPLHQLSVSGNLAAWLNTQQRSQKQNRTRDKAMQPKGVTQWPDNTVRLELQR